MRDDELRATFDFDAFRREYEAFLPPGRILLTGHSHQAWPRKTREAQGAYVDDAARFVDDKWERAVMPKLERAGREALARLGFAETDAIAFGKSTHELVFRLLSCLSWAKRPRVVTTTAEYHSLHRQLARLEEEGVDVTWVDARERATLAERVIAATTPGTAMVALSAVTFEDARVVANLGDVVARAAAVSAIPLVDAYHAFNAVPLDLGPAKGCAFVTAGGYKYAQYGEGGCFLRIPKDCALRPAYTGWFADFAALAKPRSRDVVYASGGDRFAGATFDASAIYRACAAFENFASFGLDVAKLRAISLRQTTRVIERLEKHDVLGRAPLVSSRDPAERGAFVAIRVKNASDVVAKLHARGVRVDARGELLRIGPAPYLRDAEIDDGVAALAEALS